jgi:hypothetical protein
MTNVDRKRIGKTRFRRLTGFRVQARIQSTGKTARLSMSGANDDDAEFEWDQSIPASENGFRVCGLDLLGSPAFRGGVHGRR